MAAPTELGQRVRFTRSWLQSTGSYTGTVPQLRGTVTGIRKYSGGTVLVSVDWDVHYFQTKETSVMASNLEVIK